MIGVGNRQPAGRSDDGSQRFGAGQRLFLFSPQTMLALGVLTCFSKVLDWSPGVSPGRRWCPVVVASWSPLVALIRRGAPLRARTVARGRGCNRASTAAELEHLCHQGAAAAIFGIAQRSRWSCPLPPTSQASSSIQRSSNTPVRQFSKIQPPAIQPPRQPAPTIVNHPTIPRSSHPAFQQQFARVQPLALRAALQLIELRPKALRVSSCILWGTIRPVVLRLVMSSPLLVLLLLLLLVLLLLHLVRSSS